MHIAGRRLVAVLVAAVGCVALALCSTALSGRVGSSASFVFFALSLPWTVSIYVVSMVFDSTSPLTVDITLAVVTLAVWRVGSTILLRTLLSPRER